MKILAKFNLLLLLASCLSFSANAQLTYGVKAGLNLAKEKISVSGIDISTSTLPTFHLGGILNYGLNDMFAIETGLEVQGKGGKLESDLGTGGTIETKSTPIYLQVPVVFQYQSNGLFIGAGPYLGFGIAGKAKVGSESESLNFGSKVEDDYSPLDLGLRIGAGYMMSNGFRIGASYDLGLANTIPNDARDDANDAKGTHGVIGISLGYMFGGMGDK